MESKTLQVTHGPRSNLQSVTVMLNGVLPNERLTPRMAARAARVACGHRSGVMVWDSENDLGYRLYAKSARKLFPEPEWRTN